MEVIIVPMITIREMVLNKMRARIVVKAFFRIGFTLLLFYKNSIPITLVRIAFYCTSHKVMTILS
jgi:hypothetical protein